MTVWALAEAKSRGFAVKEETFADLVKWTKERLKDIDKPRDTVPERRRRDRGFLGDASRLFREGAAINREARELAGLRWCLGGLALSDAMSGHAELAGAADKACGRAQLAGKELAAARQRRRALRDLRQRLD